jgi:hypothetical protein
MALISAPSGVMTCQARGAQRSAVGEARARATSGEVRRRRRQQERAQPHLIDDHELDGPRQRRLHPRLHAQHRLHGVKELDGAGRLRDDAAQRRRGEARRRAAVGKATGKDNETARAPTTRS